MNYRLMRISAAFLPLAMFAACLLGAEGQAQDICLAYFMLQLFALCPAEAFRNAAAREPGARRVDQRFGAALTQLIIGCILLAGCIYFLTNGTTAYDRQFSSFDPWSLIPLAGIAALMIIEQMFDERLYAVGRPADGAIYAAFCDGLLLTGMLLDRNGGVYMLFSLCAAGLGALIGLIFSLAAQPFRAFSLVPRNYAFVPKAFVQFMLYPAACAAVSIWLYELSFAPVMAGWLLWRLMRSYARRSGDESRGMNFFLITVCAVLIIAVEFCWPAFEYAACAMIALVCAEIAFLAPSVRLYAGTLLLAGAMAAIDRIEYAYYVSVLLALAAVVLNLKRALLRKI